MCAPRLPPQVLKIEDQGGEVGFRYYIHYLGWAKKYDEWVLGERIAIDCEQSRAEQQKLTEAVKTRLAAAKKKPSVSAGVKRAKRPADSSVDDSDEDAGSARADFGDPDTVSLCCAHPGAAQLFCRTCVDFFAVGRPAPRCW